MFLPAQWPAPPQVKAYTTSRRGGLDAQPLLPPLLPRCWREERVGERRVKTATPAVSTLLSLTLSSRQQRGRRRDNSYAEFNLALHVGDNPAQVALNRKHLRENLNLPAEPIWINQVHGIRVVEAVPENRDQEADASFTCEPNQVCAVLTADCLPILLCNKQGTRAAAIHAGWRGLAHGIIGETLQALGVNNQDMLAWLGPAIGPQKFEVGEDVLRVFTALNNENKTAFTKLTGAKWLADIYELARIQLRGHSVTDIYGGECCTYTQAQDYFSYRRDQGKTGRMASLIWIEPCHPEVGGLRPEA